MANIKGNINVGYGNTLTGTTKSSITGGENNSINNGATQSFIGGGFTNEIFNDNSSIIGGTGNTVNHTNTHILGSSITSVSANTTHVESLNIKTLNGTTSVMGLGLDVNGMVVSATTGSGGIYGGDGTIPTNTVATLTDTLSFMGGFVGIGTATPTSKLHVQGGTPSTAKTLLIEDSLLNPNLVVQDDGFVGIGTSTQSAGSETLGVSGGAKIGNNLVVGTSSLNLSYGILSEHISNSVGVGIRSVVGNTTGGVTITKSLSLAATGNGTTTELYGSHLEDFVIGTSNNNAISAYGNFSTIRNNNINAPTTQKTYGSYYDVFTQGGAGTVSAEMVGVYSKLRVSNGDADGKWRAGVFEINSASYIGTDALAIEAIGNSYFNGNVGIGTATPTESLDVNGSFKLTDGTELDGYVLTSDSGGTATWQVPLSVDVIADTGTTINFITRTIFDLPTSPSTGNYTDDLTGAKIGTVQKLYHNSGTPPTFPAGWVLLGDGVYFTSQLNIIYAEWVDGTRVEYWIVQEQ